MNIIKKFFHYLFKDMPLNDFEDYDDYWNKRGFNAPALKRAKIISKYIPPFSQILDVGCGGGGVIDYLSKHNSPSKIMGIDISSMAIQHLSNRGFDGKVIDIQSENFKIFLKNKEFDYIIITEVLEHIQNPEGVILTFREILPNAIIFVSIPNAGFIMHRLRLLFGRFPLVLIICHVKEHIRFWTHKDFKLWLNYLGYKIKSRDGISSFKLFGIYIGRIFPSLFAQQIIYQIYKIGECK